MMIFDGNSKKRLWGLEARKRFRSDVFFRERPDRLYHVDEKPKGGIVRKIALVGTTPSAQLAPFEDPSWEIWGVGIRQGWVTRATRWYEVHRLEGDGEEWTDEWRRQVASFNGGIDFWMHHPMPDFGDRVFAYPVEDVLQRFGSHFLTSTFSWMMAHAIHELCPPGGGTVSSEIAIYGVDMEQDVEYLQQRAGFQHFISLARFAGIFITRLASSGLSYEPIPYPMRIDDPMLNKLDLRQGHSRNMLVELDKMKANGERLIGEDKAIIATLKEYGCGDRRVPGELERLEKELSNLEDGLVTVKEDLIHWDSLEEEQQWLRNYIT